MPQSALDPTTPAAERLALARQTGVFYSRQSETALRDRWSRECSDAGSPIVHAISSPKAGLGAVRINLRTTQWRLTEIGQAIARWIAAEHGGCILALDEEIVDVLRLPPAGAAILMAHVLKRDDMLWPAPEVR